MHEVSKLAAACSDGPESAMGRPPSHYVAALIMVLMILLIVTE